MEKVNIRHHSDATKQKISRTQKLNQHRIKKALKEQQLNFFEDDIHSMNGDAMDAEDYWVGFRDNCIDKFLALLDAITMFVQCSDILEEDLPYDLKLRSIMKND